MQDEKGEIIPALKNLWSKSKVWVKRHLSATDDLLTRLQQILSRRTKELNQFLESQTHLVKEINVKQKEIQVLHERVNQTEAAKTQILNDLYIQLNDRSAELIKIQSQYISLQTEREAFSERINKVTLEKDQVLEDRNGLRIEYDNLQVIHKHNVQKLEQLYTEMAQLEVKQDGVSNEVYEEQLQTKQEEIKQLETEQAAHLAEIEEIGKVLLAKSKEISMLNQSIDALDQQLIKRTDMCNNLQVQFDNAASRLSEQDQKYQLYKKKSKAQIQTYKKQIADKEKDLQIRENELDELQSIHEGITNSYEEDINKLNVALTKTQNELAIEQASNSELEDLPRETERILRREYEPRFNKLYTNCAFQKEFLNDFLLLATSDRLKVEAAIAQLNQNFDQNMQNVRPNTAKTNLGAIKEYPFGGDTPGRIYLTKKAGKVILYRISRGKNSNSRLDQKRVIAWLEMNLEKKA